MPKILYFITICTLFRRNGKTLIFSDISSMIHIYNVRNGPYLAFVAPIRPYLSDDGLEDYHQRKALRFPYDGPEGFL
jgi:hypothetical protein